MIPQRHQDNRLAARAIPATKFVRTWRTHKRPLWRRARWVPTIDHRALGAAVDFLGILQPVEIAWEDWAETYGGAYVWHDEAGHHVRLAEWPGRTPRELSRFLWHELWHCKIRDTRRELNDHDAYVLYYQNILWEEIYAQLAEEFDYLERLIVLRKETR